MSHRAMIDGTAYEVTGGKTMVDGTVYSITGGKTLVDGTVYGIDFGSAEIPVSFDGTHTIYGDGKRGWIEITGKGTLTVLRSITADIYLLGKGSSGANGVSKYVKYETSNTWSVDGGTGGNGGKYLEVYGQTLSGTYEASFTAPNSDSSKSSTSGSNTKLGDWNSYNGTSAARGGTATYSGSVSGNDNANQISLSSGSPASGGDGRQPFAGNTPMSQGNAAKKLGAGGGSGGLRKAHLKVTYTGDPSDPSGITKSYEEEQKSVVKATASSGETAGDFGSGGSGGYANIVNGPEQESIGKNHVSNYNGASGKTGIIIVRWGY